ncbi:MAG: ribonuclease R, partial [Alphaproteobacteria bacterium HGW-Alphaproteobacteria-2]
GRIAGIARFGVFVRLAESGAEGFIPISTLGREYFHYDRDSQTLMGEHSGLTLGLGTPVLVRLAEAVPVTGGLILELLEVAGATMPRGPQRSARGGPRRKLGKHRQKAQKLKRKSGRRPG